MCGLYWLVCSAHIAFDDKVHTNILSIWAHPPTPIQKIQYVTGYAHSLLKNTQTFSNVQSGILIMKMVVAFDS